MQAGTGYERRGMKMTKLRMLGEYQRELWSMKKMKIMKRMTTKTAMKKLNFKNCGPMKRTN